MFTIGCTVYFSRVGGCIFQKILIADFCRTYFFFYYLVNIFTAFQTRKTVNLSVLLLLVGILTNYCGKQSFSEKLRKICCEKLSLKIIIL